MGLFTSTATAIRKGLSRTRQALGESLRGLLLGYRLDEEAIDQVEARLMRADVGPGATAEIVQELREACREHRITDGAEALHLLKDRLKARLGGGDRQLRMAASGPTVILVVGVNGSGKTTSAAKIGRALMDQGRTVLLAAADTYRAGAMAQLEIWASRLGADLVKGSPNADPASVAYDAIDAAIARGRDVVLIDTAGRLQNQDHLMRQLTKVRNVVAGKVDGAPHEVLLVLDATAGQNAIAQARIFQKAVDVTGIFLAKLDGTAKGGITIAIHDALGIPVKLVGLGETPQDVEMFDPDAFVEGMFAE